MSFYPCLASNQGHSSLPFLCLGSRTTVQWRTELSSDFYTIKELVALFILLGTSWEDAQHREDSRLTNFNGTKWQYNKILYTFTKKPLSNVSGNYRKQAVESTSLWRFSLEFELEISILVFSLQPWNGRRNSQYDQYSKQIPPVPQKNMLLTHQPPSFSSSQWSAKSTVIAHSYPSSPRQKLTSPTFTAL